MKILKTIFKVLGWIVFIFLMLGLMIDAIDPTISKVSRLLYGVLAVAGVITILYHLIIKKYRKKLKKTKA